MQLDGTPFVRAMMAQGYTEEEARNAIALVAAFADTGARYPVTVTGQIGRRYCQVVADVMDGKLLLLGLTPM